MNAKHSKGIILADTIFLTTGILSASFGLKSFLVPNHFLDGGIVGISLLLHETLHWHVGLVLFLLNLPFVLIAYRQMGKLFALRTLITIVGVIACFQFIHFPELVHDKVLVAAFGGFFLGVGVGLCMRGGGTFDGIEIIAMMTVGKVGFTITEIILGINILTFTIAAFFLNIETALYAILTYFVASHATRYVIEGIEAYTGVTIISSKSEIIKSSLVNTLQKGITIYKGERGFMKDNFEISNECDIVFTVVTRLEVRRLKNLVHKLDPNAFIFTSTVREASGGILKEIIKH